MTRADIDRERRLGIGKSADMAEARADVLLKFVEGGLVKDARSQLTLVLEAFQLAESAQLVFPRLPRGRTDTVQTYSAVADAYRLSRTDLQARAVRGLLRIEAEQAARKAPLFRDQPRASELFQRIQMAPLPTLDCSSPSTYDFSYYYQTLESVLKSGLGKAERLEVLLRQLSMAGSPAHWGSLIAIIALTEQELQERLMSQLVGSLESARFDSRSFEAEQELFLRSTAALASALKRRGSAASIGIVAATRKLIVRQLNQALCESPRSRGAEFDAILTFNTSVLPHAGDPSIAAVLPREVSRKKDAASRIVTPFWTDPKSKSLVERSAVVVFGGTAQDRGSPAWGKSAAALLDDLRQFEVVGDHSEVRFCEKASLLRDFIQLRVDPTPVSTRMDPATAFRDQPVYPGQDLALLEAVRLLSSGEGLRMKTRNRGAWLRTVHDLYTFYVHSRPAERNILGRAFAESGDPTLYAYGRLVQEGASEP